MYAVGTVQASVRVRPGIKDFQISNFTLLSAAIMGMKLGKKEDSLLEKRRTSLRIFRSLRKADVLEDTVVILLDPRSLWHFFVTISMTFFIALFVCPLGVLRFVSFLTPLDRIRQGPRENLN